MKSIKILGSGCAKCVALYKNAEEAAKSIGIEYRIEKVTDFQKIMEYGVMVTPALVIDEVVKASGKILSVKDIEALLGALA
jgi:small redox-active disulfide protein 2